MCYNITKKKPLKIFEFAVPQIQKSNLDWSDNNQGVTIGNHNIQANHGDYWVFTWIWFDSDCSRKNETTHHFSFRQKQVIEPRQRSQRPETFEIRQSTIWYTGSLGPWNKRLVKKRLMFQALFSCSRNLANFFAKPKVIWIVSR